MSIYFSAITGGFFDDRIHGGNIPVDAVEITRAQHAELLAGQGMGAVIGVDAAGLPILIDPPVYEPTADDHRAAVAAERYKREIAGITLDGLPIDTGRDSQALITGATVQAMLDPAYALRWKTTEGFVELTSEQIIGLAQAVRAHVQACFDREAELLDAIDADTFTDAMLEEGWPVGSLPPTPSS